MPADELEREVVELARELIRVDTANPPGRETPAAELVATYLDGAGVESELVGPDPERLNLVARVEGEGAAPSIMLMGHIDVVPAPPADWTVPPFEATLRDGQLVGRGAVDMKGEVAARAAAIAALARSGERPPGDVVLVAESDEEANTADVGMSWLVRERPELRCDFALNEGGGSLLELANGRRIVTVSVGEKQVTSLRLRIHGRAAHASVPAFGDNPVRHAAAASARLLDYEPPASEVPSILRALSSIGAPAEPDEAIEWAATQHPLLADMLPAMTRMTVTPTGLQTFEPANVIPPFADVTCDCRAVAGQTVDDVHRHVERALGDQFEYELALLEPLQGGTESPIDTPLYGIMERYVAERLPGAELFPVVTPGFTDSHFVRDAHGTVAYGFAPVFSTDPSAYARAAHAADEALDVADLVEMARFHLHAIRGGVGDLASV
jgi:acetylornithine deacetylase/succinyl-diaminopimelate desuccinylase-like protein